MVRRRVRKKTPIEKRTKKIYKVHKNLERIGQLDINFIFNCMDKGNNPFKELFILTSPRLKLFKTKGISCIFCGISGTYFAIERTLGGSGRFHLNLYGLDKSNEEVLLTR
jgi:hypothetical protein